MKQYWQDLYGSRYFWLHLAKIELKGKFRRSKLGILWTFISPMCLTLIMSVMFAVVFHQRIRYMGPYILAGLLFWELLTNSLVTGSTAIIANEAYIRQYSHPLTIYTLKSALVYTVSFALASVSMVIWIAVFYPQNLLIGFLSFPLTLIIFFCLAWAGTTIAAYTNTKYRDYPQMMPLILQALWYVSPVFFQESMFQGHALLHRWFLINPITHMLQLLRKPFLEGAFPDPINYFVTILFIMVMAIIAIRINKINARDCIFYI